VKLLLVLLSVLAVLAAGCGGGGTKAAEPKDLTSRDLCDRLDLAKLHTLTGDDWKRAIPKKGYVGCEVRITEDAPARIYVSVEAEAAKPKPDPALAREFFDEDTHYAGFRPVKGVGEVARFRSTAGDLFVLDHAITYSVQVLSDRMRGAKALKPALAIYRIVRNS
jgi:hypothetical protein